jgi:SRSO17 transposase
VVTAEVVDSWESNLADLFAQFAGRFARVETRRRAFAYVRGLLSPLERKNGWTLAERSGAVSPDGMQRLLRKASWDADGVRDDVRGWVFSQLGDDISGVLVVDETGFLKKGTRSAGVQRQYSGTAGRIENCQLGVFLTYASRHGHALADRELYLPSSWTGDRARCAGADVGAEVGFATKPQLARAMVARALAADAPARWVTADEAYGQNPALRTWLESPEVAARVGYVLATRSDDRLAGVDGHRRAATTMAAAVPAGAWERRSAGAGAHGHRLYDWAHLTLSDAGLGDGHARWLLVRRSITDPSELAFYRCAGPAETTLTELVRVAGARWTVEECFQQAKNEAGLDHYQVRSYTAWYRHITLAIAAHAWLAVTRHHARPAPQKGALPAQKPA